MFNPGDKVKATLFNDTLYGIVEVCLPYTLTMSFHLYNTEGTITLPPSYFELVSDEEYEENA